jgi:serine/threonine protein kinase/tetratricopeptide (TPR) repeat protein
MTLSNNEKHNHAAVPPAAQLTTERLLAIEEHTHSRELLEHLVASDDCADVADVADCLQLMERVRQFHPECLVDLQLGSADQPTLWLDAQDSLPQQFGRFEIRQLLGEGGFGLVFLAYDPNLEREVALKLPRIATLVTDTTRERFVREARTAASLRHPNIATVHESGQVGPICYIASEYYEGGTLAQFLQRRGPLDCREAAKLLAALAHAVQVAHSRGILHRDLKPGNVLIDRPAGEATYGPADVRITDFGLARLLDDDTQATQSGVLLGTPAYISPEQAAGEREAISTAADIYSLGAIFFELLTGRPPFTEGSVLALLEAVRSKEPGSPRRLRVDVPRDLEAICLRCLRKEPEKRYPTANALAEDLDAWLGGRPVSARPVSRLERIGRWCRRNPLLATISTVAVAAVLVGSVISTVLWREAVHHAQRAESRSEQLARAVGNLRSAVETLFVTVSESPELKGYDAEPLRRKLLEQAGKYYQLVRAELPADSQLQIDHAQTMFRLGQVNLQLGDLQAAEQIMREALRVLESASLVTSTWQQELEWNRRLAHVLDKMGRHDEARDIQRSAIELADATMVDNPQDQQRLRIATAMFWSDMAGGALLQSDLVAAGEAARESLAIWQTLPALDRPGEHVSHVRARAGSLRILGIAEEETGKLDDAEHHHRMAIDLLEPCAHADKSIDTWMLLGRVYNKLGIAVAKQDRLDEAREIYETGLRHLTELQQRHPRVPECLMECCSTRYSLAVTEFLGGNRQRTLELLQQNVQDYAQLAASSADQRFDYLNRQGIAWNMIYAVHQADGDLEQAAEAIRRALECYAEVERDRPDWIFNQVVIGESEVNLADLLAESNDVAAVRQGYETAQHRLAAVISGQPDHDRARRALYGVRNGLAQLAYREGQWQAAKELNDAALELFQDATAWNAILRSSQLQAKEGRHAAALETIEQFIAHTARTQNHYLNAARGAASILDFESVSEESMREAFRTLGLQAIEQAEQLEQGDLEQFRQRLRDDEKLAPLLED